MKMMTEEKVLHATEDLYLSVLVEGYKWVVGVCRGRSSRGTVTHLKLLEYTNFFTNKYK